MLALSRNQIRRLDQLAIESLGIPGVVLMENAGRSAAAAIGDLLRCKRHKQPAAAQVAVVCGSGNNGGDGYVIARHLHNHGAQVTVYSTKNPTLLGGDALTHCHIAIKMAIPIIWIDDAEALNRCSARWHNCDVVVDAILGTGFTGRLCPHIGQVIAACNQVHRAGALLAAVDIPSGLDSDTGKPSEPAIEADLTVTFVAAKVGFARSAAAKYLGDIVVGDIGTPPSLIDRVQAE